MRPPPDPLPEGGGDLHFPGIAGFCHSSHFPAALVAER
jgi:hypothetical protein